MDDILVKTFADQEEKEDSQIPQESEIRSRYTGESVSSSQEKEPKCFLRSVTIFSAMLYANKEMILKHLQRL